MFRNLTRLDRCLGSHCRNVGLPQPCDQTVDGNEGANGPARRSPLPARSAADEPKPSMSDMKMDAPLVPVQLLPGEDAEHGADQYSRVQATDDIYARLARWTSTSVFCLTCRYAFPATSAKCFSATYQYVRKGEPLFTIYSPDLVARQQEYLLARQNQKALGTSTVDGVASGAEVVVSRRRTTFGAMGKFLSEIAKAEGNRQNQLPPTSPSTRPLRAISPSEMLCPICMREPF